MHVFLFSLCIIVSNQIILPVQYIYCVFSYLDAPRISFGKYNPLSVLENSRVSLQCLTDANPPPVLYVWWRNDVELSGM